MSTHELYTNRDFFEINKKKTQQKILPKKKYVSPKLTKLSATEKIEGGDFVNLNENSSGLVSGAVS